MFQMKMIFFAVPVRRNSEENCETGTKNSCDLFPGGGGDSAYEKGGDARRLA